MLKTLKSLLWGVIQPLMQIVGRAYVPGPELEDALRIARREAEEGRACTVGYFAEDDDPPAKVADISLRALQAVQSLPLPSYVSLKVPPMHYDPVLLQPLLACAKAGGVRAHFDSHGIDMAESTLRCVRQAVDAGCQAGLTIPGCWARSAADARLVTGWGVRVRVVKGEWPDPDDPCRDGTAGFLEVIDALCGSSQEVAVATHDPITARESIRRLQAAGTRCELELLFGMPMRSLLALAAETRVAVRLYIPFGTAWWPYSLGKALQRPQIFWWLLVDALLGVRQWWQRRG